MSLAEDLKLSAPGRQPCLLQYSLSIACLLVLILQDEEYGGIMKVMLITPLFHFFVLTFSSLSHPLRTMSRSSWGVRVSFETCLHILIAFLLYIYIYIYITIWGTCILNYIVCQGLAKLKLGGVIGILFLHIAGIFGALLHHSHT